MNGSVKNMNNKKIIMVSGGFDPIHVGHIRLFKEAKALGNKLIIVLNNDHWLKKKKGAVFMSEDDRKEIIESLACVDKVIISGHLENPSDMSVCVELRQIKPDIFANGGDRLLNNIPEVAVCQEIGTQMVFGVGGNKLRSSSELLRNYSVSPEK